MQHIMQIALDFDDDRIRKQVEQEGYQKICNDIKQVIISRLFTSRSAFSAVDPKRDPFSDLAETVVKEAFAENKAEIIERAAQIVADSIKKSKNYKEYVKQIGEET